MQPNGVIKFFDSADYFYPYGFYRDIPVSQYPTLVNEDYLLPFQITRDATGDAITVFKCVGINVDDFSLSADIASLTIQEFTDGFEQIIWDSQTALDTTVPDGYYYIQMEDGVNTWYSNPFLIGDYPVAKYGFGAFDGGFSDGFLTEGISEVAGSGWIILNFLNYKDIKNKIYQYNYQDILILDERHQVRINYNQPKQVIERDDSTGKEIITGVYHYNEFIVTFYHNKDVAEFLKECNILDKFTLIDWNLDEFESYDFEVETSETDVPEINKITVKYRLNYVDKSKCNVDY